MNPLPYCNTKLRISMLSALLTMGGYLTDAGAQPASDAPRGELLYSTYCIACHNTQVHWRDKKIATDWATLRIQVNRWQEVASLKWSNEDITEVARYLNTLHYHYPAPD